MADFPTLSIDFDASSFEVEIDNPSVEPEKTDGGYLITRPRYTRTPPKTYKFKYVNISHADRLLLETFWNTTVKGSSVAFNWTEPTTSAVKNVRFGPGTKLTFNRIGFGTNHRYETGEIRLVEV